MLVKRKDVGRRKSRPRLLRQGSEASDEETEERLQKLNCLERSDTDKSRWSMEHKMLSGVEVEEEGDDDNDDERVVDKLLKEYTTFFDG